MKLPHFSPAARARLTAGALALVVAACSGGADANDTAARRATTTSSSTTTSTTAPPTTTSSTATTAPAAAPGLGRGARGAEVKAMEEKLVTQRYDVGPVDGVFDATTGHAVMAFQKVHGMARSGRATPDVLAKLETAGPPGPLMADGGANRVEVDLKRQILLLFKGGELNRVVSVSTGSGKRYCVDGQCATAVTPGGSFRVTRRIRGWRTSRLGKLYNPLYFNGGIAIHGAASVPAYPASHGCVRIPMSTAEWFPGAVPNGTPVYVIGGPRAPVPFNEPAPGEAPPNPPSSTTTTRPGSPPPTPPSTTTTTPSTTSTTSGVVP